MCGLIYGKRADKQPISKSILKRYKSQSGRGKQGFGYVTVQNNKIENYKRFETEAEMERELLGETASEILFHHRLPTSTPNEAHFNHPFHIKHKSFKHDYYFVHNGVITNDSVLKTKHDKLGYDYMTEEVKTVTTITRTEVRGVYDEDVDVKETAKYNDSEALALEVARYIEGLQENIEAIGSIAFICIQTDKKGNVKKLFYGRNDGNPLIVERDKNAKMFFLKSEGAGYKMDADEIVSVDALTGESEIENTPVGKRYTYQSSNSSTPTSRSRHWCHQRLAYKVWDEHTHDFVYEPTTQRTIGFSTEDEDDEDYKRDTTEELDDTAVLEDLLAENENKIEVAVEQEFQLVAKQKELNKRLAHAKTKQDMFTINSDLMSVTDDLLDVRRQIATLEDERDKLDDIEQGMAMQNAKLLEANL